MTEAQKKTLKSINKRKALRQIRLLSSRSFWQGFDFACQLLEDLGYTKTSTHPYNIADCLKVKMNRLPKNKIRKNVFAKKNGR